MCVCLIKNYYVESTINEDRLKQQEQLERTRIQKEHEKKVFRKFRRSL